MVQVRNRKLISMLTALTFTISLMVPLSANAATYNVSDASGLKNALSNAKAGDHIVLAAGATISGNFVAAKNGSSASPIYIESASTSSKATLKGTGTASGYGLQITGDYYVVKNIKVTNSQKGIMLDNSNYTVIDGVEVYNIGMEGVHFRDGSSYNTLQNSSIHDTGKDTADYGEGVYVGSDSSASYNHTVKGNKILSTKIGPGVTAEHIDIKEGADGTIVQDCTFNGTGISGANSADSFIDIKGVNSKIYGNTGSRNGNSKIADAFQVREHGSSYATGNNNDFKDNKVNLDGVGYIVNVVSGSVNKASNNTRSDNSTKLYLGTITKY